jgi:putative transposase
MQGYEWLLAVPGYVWKQAVRDLDKNINLSINNPSINFPKLRKKNKEKPSFYQVKNFLVQVDSNHIRLTGIDDPVRTVNLDDPPQLLTPDDMTNLRIFFDGKFWMLGYSHAILSVPAMYVGWVYTDKIGIDLGVKEFATVSNGKVFHNINKTPYMRKLIKRLNRLERQLERKRTMNTAEDADRPTTTNNMIKLERQISLLNRRINNIRDTYLHNVTSDLVRNTPESITIEDLDIHALLQSSLKDEIRREEFDKFRMYITYKAYIYGVKLVVADRYFPSSQLCSGCGHRKADLQLSDRVYVCPECGLTIDRDLNAAINLANYAE